MTPVIIAGPRSGEQLEEIDGWLRSNTKGRVEVIPSSGRDFGTDGLYNGEPSKPIVKREVSHENPEHELRTIIDLDYLFGDTVYEFEDKSEAILFKLTLGGN